MSLSFLVPAFLAGLLALAIPVLIHLTRKQTRTAVSFPSLMFIRQIPHKSTSRRTIHRWPLLLLRLAALALLIFAFARPFVDREGAAASIATSGGREVVVLLDRSYSMGFGDRWERALEAAEEAIDGIGSADRGSILLFDSRAEALVPPTMDRGELRAALRGARPGPRTTRYAPALRYAQRLLTGSPLPRHEVVLISDFQRAGWDADASEASSIRMPAGTVIHTVDLGEADGSNVTVASISVDRAVAAGSERATVSVRLVANEDAFRDVPVSLEVDGREIETMQASFGSGRSAAVQFSALTLAPDAPTRGSIRIPGDALEVDNTFNFVLAADQRIGVLIVEGPGTPPQASFYLDAALRLGQAPGFRVETRNVGSISAADLTQFPVMIFNQTALPAGEIGRRLQARTEAGGGLVFILGDNGPGEWTGVLPAAGRVVDRSSAGGTTLGFVDMGHPIFAPFSTPRSGDFTAARVFQYRSLTGSERILARFGDGGAALIEQPVGSGRVLLWTSTLDGRWNDLALQPVFLPFIHQVARYAAGYAPSAPWQVVGDPFDPGAMDPSAEPLTLALTPGGDRVPMDSGTPLLLEEPGFYELRNQRTGDRGAVVAVNVDAEEASMESFDPAELIAAVTTSVAAAPGADGEVVLTIEEREKQQNAWWYLVVVAFMILAAESVLSNRYYRAATPTRA